MRNILICLVLISLAGCTAPINKAIKKLNMNPYPRFVDGKLLGGVVSFVPNDIVPVLTTNSDCRLFADGEGKYEQINLPKTEGKFIAKAGVPAKMLERLATGLSDSELAAGIDKIVNIEFKNATLAEHDIVTIVQRLNSLTEECKRLLYKNSEIYVIFRELFTEGIEYQSSVKIGSLISADDEPVPLDEDTVQDTNGNVLYYYKGDTLEEKKPFRVAFQVLEVTGLLDGQIKTTPLPPAALGRIVDLGGF